MQQYEKEELTDSLQSVDWTFEDQSSGEFENQGVRTFSYDRKNGGKGTYKEYDGPLFDEDDPIFDLWSYGEDEEE